jgi:hypothetical protein
VFDRLLDRTAVEARSDERHLQISALDALGLVRQEPDGSLQPRVPEGQFHPVCVLVGEAHRDGSGAPWVPFRRVGREGPLERLDALVRVRAPPRRLAQALPVLPAQVLAVAERAEPFVRVLPRMFFESPASVITDLDVGHHATSPASWQVPFSGWFLPTTLRDRPSHTSSNASTASDFPFSDKGPTGLAKIAPPRDATVAAPART